MKPSSPSRSKGHAKARRKTREELNQEARDRKRQKKRRGHAPGSRAAGGNTTSGSKGQNAPKDPRIGSKTPIPLGVTEKVTKQHKPKSEKPMLSPQAELELLETDERLDALLERLEAGETLSAEEQSWVDAKLITLPVICYLVWLFVKLQRLSRRQKWLRNRLMTRNGHPPVRRSRQRRHRKE